MNQKIEFSNRLRQALIDSGYEPRPAILEREFNQRYWGRPVTFQAVRHWLRGEAIPAQDKLQILSDWLNIEPHILRFGEGPIKAIQDKRKRWDEGIGFQEREVFEAFLNLPAEQRKAVREIILGLVRTEKS